jgi:hypothetical protein
MQNDRFGSIAREVLGISILDEIEKMENAEARAGMATVEDQL